MDQNKAIVSDLFNFLEASTSAYHAVLECERRLVEKGYVKLDMSVNWSIGASQKYYVMPNDSMLVAINVASEMHKLNRFKVIAAHNDSPSFKVKTKSEMTYENCLKLNTEVYGAPILNTWLDRVLALAGKVALKSEDILQPNIKYVDLKNCLLTIPNIAIHMNRKMNEGVTLNPQVDLLPILALIEDKLEAKGYLTNLIAKALNVQASDILDFDLFLYLTEKGALIGADEDLISAPRLDDLAMVYASMQALMNSEVSRGINVAVCFNHEEVGNTSIEGADSNVLAMIMERLTLAYNNTKEQYYRMLD
ncbi:MAG: M18 family aminopeptidase, partial [Vallitaleaceae bacterium]|nr:M18 family aminopeptidase [Vallitaleaceae bacterium]